MIAVKEQNMIEVYANDAGEIVIKSKSFDEDQCVFFWPENSDAVIQAIRAVQKELRDEAPTHVKEPK